MMREVYVDGLDIYIYIYTIYTANMGSDVECIIVRIQFTLYSVNMYIHCTVYVVHRTPLPKYTVRSSNIVV